LPDTASAQRDSPVFLDLRPRDAIKFAGRCAFLTEEAVDCMRRLVSMLSIIVKHNAAPAPPEHQSGAKPRRTSAHNENVVSSRQFRLLGSG